MKFTKHAKKQAQRRGIDSELIELIVGFGADFKAGDGTRFYRLPVSEMRFLRHECPPLLWKRYRDRMQRVTPLVSEGQEVITAMHRYKPFWKRGM